MALTISPPYHTATVSVRPNASWTLRVLKFLNDLRAARRFGLVSHCHRVGYARQPAATSNAVRLRVWRLNSTPIRWIGSPRPRYFAA